MDRGKLTWARITPAIGDHHRLQRILISVIRRMEHGHATKVDRIQLSKILDTDTAMTN